MNEGSAALLPSIVSRMARLDYPDLGTANQAVLTAAERIKDQRGGRLLNLFKMQLHNPDIATAWLDLGSAVRFKSELDAPTRELAICLVARITGADYEWRAHRRIAVGEGFTEGALDAILEWRTSEAFDARQRAVLGLADALTRTVKVDDATFSAVREALPARQVVELVATIAYYNMVSRFLVGLEIDLEAS
ncbi:MAG TPA: carboxymuconolactone decarboxylase family protein [Chloroflexota bacterium]|jgi:alkylhydroperoxidase family enzyme|nr:carboxymuconolactone decarboxylase family protein [Chloroflexota bacterium]